MAYEWARPGAKVVCIDDHEAVAPDGMGMTQPLAAGTVYQVLMVAGSHCRYKGRLGDWVVLVLQGVQNPSGGGWNAVRFRPLVTRTLEQDLALFRHRLTGAPAHSEDA